MNTFTPCCRKSSVSQTTVRLAALAFLKEWKLVTITRTVSRFIVNEDVLKMRDNEHWYKGVSVICFHLHIGTMITGRACPSGIRIPPTHTTLNQRTPKYFHHYLTNQLVIVLQTPTSKCNEIL